MMPKVVRCGLTPATLFQRLRLHELLRYELLRWGPRRHGVPLRVAQQRTRRRRHRALERVGLEPIERHRHAAAVDHVHSGRLQPGVDSLRDDGAATTREGLDHRAIHDGAQLDWPALRQREAAAVRSDRKRRPAGRFDREGHIRHRGGARKQAEAHGRAGDERLREARDHVELDTGDWHARRAAGTQAAAAQRDGRAFAQRRELCDRVEERTPDVLGVGGDYARDRLDAAPLAERLAILLAHPADEDSRAAAPRVGERLGGVEGAIVAPLRRVGHERRVGRGA
mmetsp:Transcript_29607/g.86568  ORF Transcript_29607/g.86568 Transcript_29607/m.86568 type:complete len:283 (-) Transcript_29607:57-905(-)